MTEQVHTGGKYDDDNIDSGGGAQYGWEDRTVLITGSIFSGERGFASYHLTGVPDGETEERVKFYSAGNNTVSEDGETIGPPPGKDRLVLGAKSEFRRFVNGLSKSGMTKAEVIEFEAKVSSLVGKKLHFRELEVYTADGKVKMATSKTNGREYPQTKPFPAEGGYKREGKPGNGHATEAIEAKAVEAVLAAAQLTGGKATYTEVSRKLNEALATDPDKLKVLSLVADRKWFKIPGRPWQTDGTAITI